MIEVICDYCKKKIKKGRIEFCAHCKKITCEECMKKKENPKNP